MGESEGGDRVNTERKKRMRGSRSLLDYSLHYSNNKTNNQMKHIAAYLLLQTGGNASPSAADIKTLLETVGIEADEAQLDKLISELDGKDINQVR